MDRYTVVVTRPQGGNLQILVPFKPASTVSQLLDEIAKRSAKQGITVEREHVVLRLGTEEGPILDLDDSLEDTIISPSGEIIVVTPRNGQKKFKSRERFEHGNNADNADNAQDCFKIRVITPSLAQKSATTDLIPLLNHGRSFSGQTMLREIRSAIQNHLGLPSDDLASLSKHSDCNCAFAKQILERGILDMPPSRNIWAADCIVLESLSQENSQQRQDRQTPSGPSSRFLVIHGKSEVEWAEAESNTNLAIRDCLLRRFGQSFQDVREVRLMSGSRTNGESESYKWTKMPIVCVCSKVRHDDLGKEETSFNEVHGFTKILDLHTFEAPITTTNYDLTVDQIGLNDLTIDGVLNLYAVTRDTTASSSARVTGKDAIFLEAEHWRPPMRQSERGMAALLSCLRVFTDLISAKEMEEHMQNVVLETTQWLTRFPPATRAMHILMDGKTPSAPECSALAQAFFEVLKGALPRSVIKGDQNRVLEASRLLLGFIMDRAKQEKFVEDSKLPYFEAYKTLDLKDAITNEIMEFPVQTNFGLVEKGYADAYGEEGILGSIKSQYAVETTSTASRFRRIAILSGGAHAELSYYDLDSLNMLAKKKTTSEDRKLVTQAFADPRFLASLCERTGLAVVAPSALRNSKAPVLTLDRDGLIAVYTGRPPCTEPPNDTAIFRPTKGGEVNVDVAIITQLLEPILAAREQDGTLVFDLFGEGAKRKDQKPEEIVIFCVDCSRSMSNAADFDEIIDEENSQTSDDDEKNLTSAGEGLIAEIGTFVNPTFEDMKDFLARHESFIDMLAIVKSIRLYDQNLRAANVIKFLTALLSREICHLLKDLRSTQRWATLAFLSSRTGQADVRITELRKYLAGLNQHKQALADFLVVKSEATTIQANTWKWKFEDPIPAAPPPLTQEIQNLISTFSVPDEFMCPIGHDLLEDAVNASDGKTYERKSIERWFQIRKTSPTTNLELADTSLRRNGPLINSIQEWVDGKAIIEQYTPPRKRLRRSTANREPTVSVRFVSPTESFTRKISQTLRVTDLFRLAYQGMKGRHTRFAMACNGEALGIDARTGTWPDNALIAITIHTSPAGSSTEQCLIKVYDTNSTELFNYWISKSTTSTLSSVLFRYWRYNEENWRSYSSHDMDVWTDMHYGGDGVSVGTPREHWKTLSSLLTATYATGTMQREDIYAKNSQDLVITGGVDDAGRNSLVLKLRLYDRKVAHASDRDKKNLSRLDVSKQVFGSFINRTLAYNYPVHIGLITFEDTAKLSQAPSGVVENFRRSVDSMEAKGDTTLWDALALASDQLEEHTRNYPEAKKRIICLSDGNDTKSQRAAQDILRPILQNNVVVDSFCVGNEDNQDLRVVSYVTGGYKFAPKSLEQAMAICEMEPVLSQLERPPLVKQQHPTRTAFNRLRGKQLTAPETVNRDVFPMRRQHPALEDTFVHLLAMAKSSQNLGTSTIASNDSFKSNMRSTRLLTEVKNIATNIHPSYDVYVSESNMGFWKVVMKGPPESAYSDGTFLLYLDMEDDYPAFPPKGRFVTPIFHPNINRHGRICHSILDRNWTTDTTNLQVINTIYSLLLVPEFTDPINTVVTLDFYWDEVQFQEEVRAHIRRHATKDREQWGKLVLGDLEEGDVKPAGDKDVGSEDEETLYDGGRPWGDDGIGRDCG